MVDDVVVFGWKRVREGAYLSKSIKGGMSTSYFFFLLYGIYLAPYCNSKIGRY